MREVILLSSQAKILLSQGDKTQIRAFLKNVGSNFMFNSKRFEFSAKNGWRARVAGEPMVSFPNWRREWDSNPRDPCGSTCFPSKRHRPLGDLSLCRARPCVLPSSLRIRDRPLGDLSIIQSMYVAFFVRPQIGQRGDLSKLRLGHYSEQLVATSERQGRDMRPLQ